MLASLRFFIRSQFGKPVDYSPDEIAKAGDVWTGEMARRAARFTESDIVPAHHASKGKR